MYLNTFCLTSLVSGQFPRSFFYADSKKVHHKSKNFTVCGAVIASDNFLGLVFQSGSL